MVAERFGRTRFARDQVRVVVESEWGAEDEPLNPSTCVEDSRRLRIGFQTRLDAWRAWSADVSASIAVATRSVQLALGNSDAEALAFAQARVATLTERRILVEASWPGLAEPAATIPWMYFDD